MEIVIKGEPKEVAELFNQISVVQKEKTETGNLASEFPIEETVLASVDRNRAGQTFRR